MAETSLSPVMAETKSPGKQTHFDYLQFVVPDFNNIPRGKIVKGKFKDKVEKQGLEIGEVVCLPGPNSEVPLAVLDVVDRRLGNSTMRPCMETLTPWPWVGGGQGRRVGNVLCDLISHDGIPNMTSPRQLLKAQLDALRKQHGLVLKSAFEYEFTVYTSGNLDSPEPLGGSNSEFASTLHWDRHHDLFCDLTDLLEQMGVEVSTLMPEFAAGQWELTTDPQEGLRGGDVAFYVKQAVKGFFQTRGKHATFMTKPTADHPNTGLHLNHSLWTLDGQSALQPSGAEGELMSSAGRHWLAGLLTHAPAITVLCCPTLNCYRRLGNFCTPGKGDWGHDDRNTMVRVHTAYNNVFMENRLPSGACCPYLAMAATVAAGLDGLNRQLTCPPATDQQAPQLPRSLKEALTMLEEDSALGALLDPQFLQCFLTSKRDWELPRHVQDTEQRQLRLERGLYFTNL